MNTAQIETTKVTVCPPAIADGANVNPLTREEVAQQRRVFITYTKEQPTTLVN